MLLLEHLAEEQILEAIERGDLNDLPGMGEPNQERTQVYPYVLQAAAYRKMTVQAIQDRIYRQKEHDFQ